MGFTSGDPMKGLRLISSRVTKLSRRYIKNTCLTVVKLSYILILIASSVQLKDMYVSEGDKNIISQFLSD